MEPVYHASARIGSPQRDAGTAVVVIFGDARDAGAGEGARGVGDVVGGGEAGSRKGERTRKARKATLRFAPFAPFRAFRAPNPHVTVMGPVMMRAGAFSHTCGGVASRIIVNRAVVQLVAVTETVALPALNGVEEKVEAVGY